MPSGWDSYYVVFLSAIVSLSIPAILSGLSRLVASRKTVPAPDHSTDLQWNEAPFSSNSSAILEKKTQEVRETALGRRINTRFFLSANASLTLVALALLLVPPIADVSFRGLISILSIALFSGLGLLYSARKGDLNWLQSFRAPTSPASPANKREK